MTLQEAQNRDIVKCCYQVLDGLSDSVSADTYQRMLQDISKSLDLGKIEHVIHWTLMNIGAIEYTAAVSYVKQTNFALDASLVERKRYPTQAEIQGQIEKYKNVIEAKLSMDKKHVDSPNVIRICFKTRQPIR